MDNREKALRELKRRIEEQKARLDPAVLKIAQEAVRARQPGAGTVPYDRPAAERAVALFLETHRDRRGFERRLAEFILRHRH